MTGRSLFFRGIPDQLFPEIDLLHTNSSSEILNARPPSSLKKKRGNKKEEQEQKQTGIILIRISFGALKINRGGAQRTNPIRWTDRRWKVLIAHKSLYPIHFGCKQIRYGLIIIIRLLYWRGKKMITTAVGKKICYQDIFPGVSSSAVSLNSLADSCIHLKDQ